MSAVEKSVLTISELFKLENLHIPEYQRPYKWTLKNVNQLIEDIKTFENHDKYRIGTIVFHKDDTNLNIVDGQQRIITLTLILSAIKNSEKKIKDTTLKNKLDAINIFNPSFKNEITKNNIIDNYKEIFKIVKNDSFNEHHIEFILNKCEVVTFILTDLSEAFQFFDSQNSRGKDLEPHDLLKAFHLREFLSKDFSEKAEIVEAWEDNCENNKKNKNDITLNDLFSNYLYLIRQWSIGNKAFDFTKSDIDVFKGIHTHNDRAKPFAQTVIFAHHYSDNYNRFFPFQMNQPVINGRRFFEMVEHYIEQVKYIKSERFLGNYEDSNCIITKLYSYDKIHRTGDKYTRILFDCLLLFYFDKFGDAQISQAIEKCFIIAYTIRLKHDVLRWETIENYVFENEFFKTLSQAIKPNNFLQKSVERLKDDRISHFKNYDSDIFKKFEELNYV